MYFFNAPEVTEEPKEPELEPEPEKQPSPPPKGAAPEFVEVYQDQVRDLKHGSKSVPFCYIFLSLKKINYYNCA